MPKQLLNRIAQRVSRIKSTQQRQEVSEYVQLLAGLKFRKELIRQVFQEGMMRESVIYQEILEEGREEGKREEGINLVLRLLARRLGKLDEAVKSQVTGLLLPLLEDLGEALLDFSELANLLDWLETH